MPRVLVPDLEAVDGAVVLPQEEAAHVTRVLRLTAGDPLRVFDGRGHEWHAVIDAVSRRQVTVRLGEPYVPAPESRLTITLATAVLKGDKMDDVVRDAVMLGIARLQPLVTERTDVMARAVQRGSRLDRWQRIAVASAKQCGRAVVPDISSPRSISDVFDSPPRGTRIVLVEPGVAGQTSRLHEVPGDVAAELVVGPEGGWTAAELAQAVAAGSMLVTLGRLTLRAERAPIIALSALRAAWDDW